jgi:hypothetical protein
MLPQTRLSVYIFSRKIVPEKYHFYQRVLNDLYEDQAFSPSYNKAPPPPSPPPLSPISKLDRRHTGRLRKRDNQREKVAGGGGGAKTYDSERILVLYKSFNIL